MDHHEESRSESNSNIHQTFQYSSDLPSGDDRVEPNGDFGIDGSALDRMKQLAEEFNISTETGGQQTRNESSYSSTGNHQSLSTRDFRTQSSSQVNSSDLLGEDFAGNQTIEESDFKQNGSDEPSQVELRQSLTESRETPQAKSHETSQDQSHGSHTETRESSGVESNKSTQQESQPTESNESSQNGTRESAKAETNQSSQQASQQSESHESSRVESNEASQAKSQETSDVKSHESSQNESSEAPQAKSQETSQVESSEASQSKSQETSQVESHESSQTQSSTNETSTESQEQVKSSDLPGEEFAGNQSSGWSVPEDEVKNSANRRFFRMTSSGLNRSPSSRYKSHGTSSHHGSEYGDSSATPSKTHSRTVSGNNWLALNPQSETNEEYSHEESSTYQNESFYHEESNSFKGESSNREESSKFQGESSNREESSSRTITQDQYNQSGYGSTLQLTSDNPPTYSQHTPINGSTYKSHRSYGSRDESPEASERSPLLPAQPDEPHEANGDVSPKKKKTSRLPSMIALAFLCVLVVLAIVFGFAAPATVEQYAKEALTFESPDFSIESFTDAGIRARIQGTMWLDGSKVQKKTVRDLGRAATWIAREVEIGRSEVTVRAPKYDNMLLENSMLGIVRLPSLKLDIRENHKNVIDIFADFEPGQAAIIQKLAKDFMDGVRDLDVKAIAKVPVRSGLIDLGNQTVNQDVHLELKDMPKTPKFDLVNLKVSEFGAPGHPEGVKAKAKVIAMNSFPVKFDVPPLALEVLLPDCEENYLMLGELNTEVVHIAPKQNVTASVTGTVRQLSTSLTKTCPNSNKSPLDRFIGKYLGGNDTSVYIRGGEQGPDTPWWVGYLLKQMVLPVPVPVRPFDNSIKNFSLSDVNFKLPELPEENPTLSASVNVVVGLPKNINIEVDVNRVRSDGNVFFRGKELGKLDLRKWQKANSTKIGDELHVQSKVVNAPLQIVDQEVFTEVIQQLIFHHSGIELGMKASVDVDTKTALGEFIVRDIPAKGDIFIKPIGGHKNNFDHNVTDISVVGSSPDELILQANVTVRNPTEYSARIPYVNISVWCNDTELGYAWGSFGIVPGLNNISVKASWSTGAVGAEFLSQYISGRNASIEMRTHPGSIPGLPDPQIALNVTVPHMFGKFLKETTMHILSSTATFILFSPLPMAVTNISSQAYYNGTEIGVIDYAELIPIVPGDNETPRLPVSWNTNGGYGVIRDALGGSLKLDAHADIGVRIGEWEANIWYEAKGLGAKVRF